MRGGPGGLTVRLAISAFRESNAVFSGAGRGSPLRKSLTPSLNTGPNIPSTFIERKVPVSSGKWRILPPGIEECPAVAGGLLIDQPAGPYSSNRTGAIDFQVRPGQHARARSVAGLSLLAHCSTSQSQLINCR
jgi:hypothetical protein